MCSSFASEDEVSFKMIFYEITKIQVIRQDMKVKQGKGEYSTSSEGLKNHVSSGSPSFEEIIPLSSSVPYYLEG